MNPELMNKWLNWLDACQGVMSQDSAIEVLERYMSKRECSKLINKWLEER